MKSRTKKSKDSQIYQREFKIIKKSHENSNKKSMTKNELLQEYTYLLDQYENLLRKIIKITTISDVNQKKLLLAHEEIKKQKEKTETVNKQLQEEIVKRKQLQQLTQKRATQAALLYKLGQRMSSKLDFDAVLNEIVTAIQDSYQYYCVMIFLYNNKKKCLIRRAKIGGKNNSISEVTSVPIGEGIVGQAALKYDAQLVNNIKKIRNYKISKKII